ncbi:MAG: hypothetical protein IJG68_00325 [Bacilli bacterium]|nr:hypothetical protein [Bacilli bacterium]
MNDYIEFFTSSEIMVVYLLSVIACLISLIIYMYRKNSENIRRKHNTRELNQLVEEVRERVPEVNNVEEHYEEPVLEQIEEVYSVSEMLDQSFPKEVEVLEEEKPVLIDSIPVELEYTTIEPNPEEARRELERLEKVLEEQEKQESKNIELTTFEQEQEACAIISMDELLAKGKQMYEENEVVQFEDEGNEPISIFDLEEKVGKKLTPLESEIKVEQPVIVETYKSVVPVEKEESKFKRSPIISPIFGIERNSTNELALENTANYEKLDEQIQKHNNDYIMSFKEFQREKL